MEVKKRDYNVLAGETHTVQARGGGVITSQPSAQSGIENYVIDLDAQQVSSMSSRFRPIPPSNNLTWDNAHRNFSSGCMDGSYAGEVL